ncbi:hypothetical protein Peur_073578 [Populus x canadensis]
MAATSHAPNPKPTLQLLKETNNNGAYSIREVFNELGVARDVLGGKSYVFYDLLIRACCELKRVEEGKGVYWFMESLGIKPNVVTYNTIIHGYFSRGRVEGARMIFDVMKCRG